MGGVKFGRNCFRRAVKLLRVFVVVSIVLQVVRLQADNIIAVEISIKHYF
jgi:hypothetical protein